MSDGVLTASTIRRDAIETWFATLRPGMTVALSTHINSDGDGCGSETALARLLAQRGIHARIVNPTPWPAMFNFLLGDDIEEASARGAAALDGIPPAVLAADAPARTNTAPNAASKTGVSAPPPPAGWPVVLFFYSSSWDNGAPFAGGEGGGNRCVLIGQFIYRIPPDFSTSIQPFLSTATSR